MDRNLFTRGFGIILLVLATIALAPYIIRWGFSTSILLFGSSEAGSIIGAFALILGVRYVLASRGEISVKMKTSVVIASLVIIAYLLLLACVYLVGKVFMADTMALGIFYIAIGFPIGIIALITAVIFSILKK